MARPRRASARSLHRQVRALDARCGMRRRASLPAPRASDKRPRAPRRPTRRGGLLEARASTRPSTLTRLVALARPLATALITSPTAAISHPDPGKAAIAPRDAFATTPAAALLPTRFPDRQSERDGAARRDSVSAALFDSSRTAISARFPGQPLPAGFSAALASPERARPHGRGARRPGCELLPRHRRGDGYGLPARRSSHQSRQPAARVPRNFTDITEHLVITQPR